MHRSFAAASVPLVLAAAPASAQCLDWSSAFPSAGAFGSWLGQRAVFDTVVHDDGSGAKLVLAGYFEGAGGVASFGVVRWNGASFEALPGLGAYAALGLDVADLGAGAELYARLAVGGAQVRLGVRTANARSTSFGAAVAGDPGVGGLGVPRRATPLPGLVPRRATGLLHERDAQPVERTRDRVVSGAPVFSRDVRAGHI